MLRLITGRAGAGKTAQIMDEIRRAASEHEGGRCLLVPEQYSHEAERELARVAGPSLPLYAEVLSFTGLARKVEAELGTGGRRPVDAGGRLLCMALALDSVYSRLRVYAGARRSPELQGQLLAAVDELSAAGFTAEQTMEAAERAPGALGQKLADLALVMGAFHAAIGPEHSDASDRLSELLRRLPESSFGRSGHIYIDGFTDFTGVEMKLLCELMSRGADMTVCLTLDALDEGSEVFELSRRTARRLLREARERGVPSRVETLEARSVRSADILAEHMLSYTEQHFDSDNSVFLYTAESVTAECELAASRAIELARSGCRWRDIAVAVRSFEDYRAQLEAAFAYYGVPLFTARQTDITQKPLPALISSAYEAVLGGWEQAEVFAYLRTGLAGLDAAECDELENYCFTWNIRASHWLSERDWHMHPDGWSGRWDEESKARLARINMLRRRAAESERCDLRGELGKRDAPVRYAALRHVLHRLCKLLERRLDVGRRKAGDRRNAELRGAPAAGQLVEQRVEFLPDDRRDERVEHLLVLRRRSGQLIRLTLHAVCRNGFLRNLLFLYAHFFTSLRNCPLHSAL